MSSEGDYAFPYFEVDHVFSHYMPSKGDNALLYISKTTMSSVIACFEKETMTLTYISKMTMSSVIACFQKATMTLIYISKMKISSVIFEM